ncbi:DUF2973 domain-containing protein [Sphaerospermopsis aphanizomenoides BCCUSP55]|uniref:DUF2973 domain-containing protein n=1 Tax=Sphaerospermopsis aphanizomenoides TaxID=459663 RepID=UPI0019087854|nr:DUF2973 domain-containing protein [Sphaerospermopsis aphanizomenoides]MBK1989389.1 DUF2973 domain-containing protein [Sphaerospermopsis aphanizomenoides BCCUSP55]
MLHLLYILAFTVLAFIAVGNLIRNLVMFSFDSSADQRYRERSYATKSSAGNKGSFGYYGAKRQSIPHPELLDSAGNLIKEPLLVMRSINVDDARQQLDALYESSPGQKIERSEEA